MTDVKLPKPNLGIFVDDRVRSGEINLEDWIHIGEFNSREVEVSTVGEFLSGAQSRFPDLTPAGRLKLLQDSFGGLRTRPGGDRVKVGDDVRKAVADLETDARFAAEREKLGQDFGRLNRDWEGYYSELDRVGRETPELKWRAARLQARTAALHRRSDALGFRERREAVVREMEAILRVDLDNRSLRVDEAGGALTISAQAARDKNRHYFVALGASGEARAGWLVSGPRGSEQRSYDLDRTDREALLRRAVEWMRPGR